MRQSGFTIEHLPEQDHPLLIAGFEGWGNAMDVSRAMVSYMIRKLDATPFARINSEPFYRYDENRPWVEIESGSLKNIAPPGGAFYTAGIPSRTAPILVLKATEPNIQWMKFVNEMVSLCMALKVETVISLGSMFDDVLHSDRIVSGMASDPELLDTLEKKGVLPITYSGPGSIHSTVHSEFKKKGVKCISLWCHCPYYLQGTSHFGILSYLGRLLASLGGFDLDVGELDLSWKKMEKQIKTQIDESPELQAMISGLQKVRASGLNGKTDPLDKKNGKVIHLKDFLEPR